MFGIAGTLSRYWIQGYVQELTGPNFPYGTFVVNLTGCFFLGLIGEYALNHVSIPPDWRIGITVGFFGAYTTFSTFEWETAHFMQDGEWIKTAIYVASSLVFGVLAMMGGLHLGNKLS